MIRIVFVGEGSRDNLTNLARILRCFHASSGLQVNFSGLQVNFHKSKEFGIGVPTSQVSNWATLLRCLPGSFPFTYLGVPVGANMNLKKHWKPVVDRLNNKLSGWKSKNLSFGGRLTLVKSVLSSLPLYYFSLFKAPCCVIEKLEQIRRRFLWGGHGNEKKISWVAWSVVMASKEKGGLGVGSLKAQNNALLLKWWWKLRDDKNCIWKNVITAVHNLSRKPVHCMATSTMGGVWCNIARVETDLIKNGYNFFTAFSLHPGYGDRFLFWKDRWLGETCFQQRFPALYSIESIKNCKIRDRINDNGYSWNWRHGLNDSTLIAELCDLMHLLTGVRLNLTLDKIKFNMASDGFFSVNVARQWLEEKVTTGGFVRMPWSNIAPLKVNCFVWRLGLGRIPVAITLRHRGINIDYVRCKICGLEEECIDHVFLKCSRAIDTLKWIFNWCEIPFPVISKVVDLIEFGAKWGNCTKKRKILVTIIQCSLWSIWKARNDHIFNSLRKSYTAIAGEIISTSFLWIKHRSKFSCNWAVWSSSPFLFPM